MTSSTRWQEVITAEVSRLVRRESPKHVVVHYRIEETGAEACVLVMALWVVPVQAVEKQVAKVIQKVHA